MELRNEVHIERPVDEVWHLVGDPSRWHRWRDRMSGPAGKRDEGPISLGSVFDYRSTFLGRSARAEFKVEVYEPPQRITVTTEVPVPATLVFRCERTKSGTRVIQETKGKVGGFFGIAEPLVAPLMKRQFQKSLQQLKEEVEAKD